MKEWHEDCIKIKSGKTAKGKPWFVAKGELKNWTPTPKGAFNDASSNEYVDNFAQ